MSSSAGPGGEAKPLIDLTAVQPPQTLEAYYTELVEYARAHAHVTPSVPSFPLPQPLAPHDPDDPPEYPAWNTPLPPSLYPTVGEDGGAGAIDTYGSGAHLQHFEQHIANVFGKPAAMFNVTGVMAQLIAIKLHAVGKNAIFASHPRSHLVLHEERAFESLLGFSHLSVIPANSSAARERPMTAADVETAFSKHWKQPSSLVIELPDREIGGQATTWEDLVAIREYTRAKGIMMHLDGARIWEIQSHYKKSYQEIAAMFDSIYVSFYKGLQSRTGGAMLLGSEAFIRDARVWQVRFGGRMYRSFQMSLGAEMAFNRNVNTLSRCADKMREVVAALTRAQQDFLQAAERTHPAAIAKLRALEAKVNPTTAASSTDATASPAVSSRSSSNFSWQPFFSFLPAVPQCAMVHMHLHLPLDEAGALRSAVITARQIIVVDRMRTTTSHACYTEFKIGVANCEIPTATFVDAWNEWMTRRLGAIDEAPATQPKA